MDAGDSRAVTRVRFKTSCTECQRRRKKCNKGKPCGNCARRYPPVDCVYESQRIHSSTKKISPGSGSSSWEGLKSQIPEAQGSTELNSLPALSSLNLPSRTLQSPVSHGAELSSDKPVLGSRPKSSSNVVRDEIEVSSRDSVVTVLRLPSPNGIAYGTSNLLHDLQVEPTSSNAELFHLYFGGILPKLWSIDGTSPAPPIIHDFWIPFMTSSPIIVHANLLRAAIWRVSHSSNSLHAYNVSDQDEWDRAHDSVEILTLKSKSISLLNERLRAPGGVSVDDEAVASVIFFFYNEWCWGVKESFDDLSPHAQGLREMLRIRGGIKNIRSKGGFIAQFVMLMNYHLAIILETESYLCPPEEHNYRYVPGYVSPKTRLDSPLYKASYPNSDGTLKWGLDGTTSHILDDIWLITANIHSYMSGNSTKFNCQDLLIQLNDKQNQILSLPMISFKGVPTIEIIIYECCRMTAIVYCRAILKYSPFSVACTEEDLNRICSAMTLVPITKWTQISGIWLWIICVVNPAARYRVEGLNLRMYLKNCTSALGLIDWQILVNCVESFLSVQRWIRQRGVATISIVYAD